MTTKPSTRRSGGASELALAAKLSLSGYDVFREVTDSSKTDLVVRVNGRYVAVQVKRRGSEPIVVVKSRGYSQAEVDIFAIHHAATDTFLFVPWEDVAVRRGGKIVIRMVEPKHRGRFPAVEAAKYLSFEDAVQRTNRVT
jgi:hypothetical protein